jgi:hypothetical protein
MTITTQMQPKARAVRKKIERLRLEVVDPKAHRTTTTLQIPDDLPNVEEFSKELAGTLKAARMAGLEKIDVQRLQVIATVARRYKEMLVDYFGYRIIERKLVDLEGKYAKSVAEKTKD